MQSSVTNPEKLAVVAVTRDETKVWRHGIGPEDLPEVVTSPIEVDHRHKRTGQYHHGHDTDHDYPEYYEAISAMLREIDVALLLGHGDGKGSAVDKFQEYLSKEHPQLASKVLDTLSVNLNAMSDHQITMNARQWFEKNFRKLATWHDRQPKRWFTGG
jgi:hypothetical protein